MLKKWMTIGFVLMLAFQPVTSVAAAPAEDEADDAQTEEAQADETDIDNEEADEESENASEEAEDESSEADEDAVEEDTEEAETTAEEDAKEEADTEDAEEATEESNEAEEEVDAQAEDEIETTATADEDLNLREIYGNASGAITYDIAQGAYVLDLRAGFSNYTNTQDIENKWVAFALPNGVDVTGELPSGTVPLFLQGKTGIAVKVPNVKGIGNESVNKEILLTGEPDDNDPVVNLYMLNVDTEANQYEEIGEVQGQRDIDFSNMQADPSIDLDGSLTGDVEYDAEKKQHFLNVTLEVDNNTDSDISELYAGFELPADVNVLDTDDTPAEYEQYRGEDEKQIGALQLPNVAPGESETVTYQIPVLGKTEAVVTADVIQLYSSNGAVGSYNGNIDLDFSAMDQDWDFEVTNEVITDYPGVNNDQKGFRFNYSAKNLTIEDVDAVSMEFIVPDGITIEKPQYIGGDYIEWDGNVATVDLENIRGGVERYGYFTAVGSTSLSIDELKDLQVKVTLYRDGETEEKVINAAFVEGKYDEDDFEDTPTDPGNGDDDEDNGDAPTPPGNGDDGDDNNTGDNGDNGNNGDGNNDDGNSTPGNTGNNNDGGDSDGDGDVSVEVEDGDDSVADGDASVEDGDDDNTLPNTATNMYSMLAAGFVMLALGGVFVAVRRRMA